MMNFFPTNSSKVNRDWTQPKSTHDPHEHDDADILELGEGEYVGQKHSELGIGGRRSPRNENAPRTRKFSIFARKKKETDVVKTASGTSAAAARGNKKGILPSGENLRVAWYGASRHLDSTFQKFSLETWWLESPMPTRMNVIMILVFLTFGIIYLTAATWFILKHFTQTIKSPYICQTEECHKASQWLTSTLNMSVDPCDNFYEFVCGDYHHNHNASVHTNEGPLMHELITDPAFKVEDGVNSIFAKMVHNFQNIPVYDQSIRFYQYCLNEPMRKQSGKFRLEAFFDTVESIFGTKDFSNFESTPVSMMEEIGANMLTHIGDAEYINVAFYIYPYIAVIRPTRKVVASDNNKEVVRTVFQNLLPLFGVTDQEKIDDAYTGVVDVFGRIKQLIEEVSYKKKYPKTFPFPDNLLEEYKTELMKQLTGLCPPMGIQLNIRKVHNRFIQEYFRYQFYDLMALKFFVGFEICFAQDGSAFTGKVQHTKLAFVAPWLFQIFWDFLLSMDTRNILKEWKINKDTFPNSSLVDGIHQQQSQHVELRCMLDLESHMGYLPIMHYLTSKVEHPFDHLEAKKEEIRQLYVDTGKWFKEIPASEMDPNMAALGGQILGRQVHVDVLMPLVSGRLNVVHDPLNFTDDHLGNSFKAIKYTVETARQNWLGSTNTEPTVKWWGSGIGRNIEYDMQSELFDIRRALIRSAELDESLEHPVSQDHTEWQKFLGRPPPNYLFYFRTIFDQPYSDETLSLKTGGIFLKIIRTIYSLISDSRTLRYMSYRDNRIYGLINMGNAKDNRNRRCDLLTVPNEHEGVHYEYLFNHSYTTGEFSWEEEHGLYHSLLTLKQSFQLLRIRREALSREKFDWYMAETNRKLIRQRLLPGKLLEKYSEEQLFFMTYVRNACRGGWKEHDDELRKKRFQLETTVLSVLMQMEEFSKVWKCKNKAFMSNQGHPRCIQWVP